MAESPSASSVVRVRPWGALAYPQFRLLAGSGLLGSVGLQMREIVNLWVVFELTGSALHLGVLGALRILPLLAIGLFGGVLADIVDRRKLLLLGQAVSLALTAALAALFVADQLRLWHVYAITLANTSATVLDARFDPAVEVTAYRIAQEALTNVARHANVVRATLEAVREGEHLRLAVVDAGKGMELDPSDPSLTHDSSGLSGMRERALAVGGDVTITSAPGEGTSIVALLPLRGAPRPE
jgi:hypothetical protein